jgi:hypothetical protein
MQISHTPNTISMPSEKSDWVCYISGDPSKVGGSVTYRPNKDKEPKWFHRQMHQLLLGVKWYKIKLDTPAPNC